MKVEVTDKEEVGIDWSIKPQILKCAHSHGFLYVAYLGDGHSDKTFNGVVLKDDSQDWKIYNYSNEFSKRLFTKFDGVITIQN